MADGSELTKDILDQFRENFCKDPKNLVALNACAAVDPLEVCVSKRSLEQAHVFQYKIETEGKPVTNQKLTGRCWIFAALNVIRIPFMKHYNLDEFEFSQSFLFFWDKVERCNFWLNNIVKTARRGEEVDGRLVSFLLQAPASDGGQWDMVYNLINKYGLMPKKNYVESFSSDSSARMNSILTSTLRDYAKTLRDMVSNKASDADVKSKIKEQMNNIYRIVAICLGIPPETFTWEYTDKSKVTRSVGPITPKEFYLQHVKHIFNVDDKICLVNDPRPTSPFGTAFTVDCLGNMEGGRRIIYNNQPIEILMQSVGESIKNNEPVWFGCHVNIRFANKAGVQDLDVHDYNLVFGVNPSLSISKADRLVYCETAMTHAMVFTGVSYDKQGNPVKFRVENSWGEDRGHKGYILMTAPWFKEFTFEVVVDKKFLSKDIVEVSNQEPKVLPAWDPMGILAQ